MVRMGWETVAQPPTFMHVCMKICPDANRAQRSMGTVSAHRHDMLGARTTGSRLPLLLHGLGIGKQFGAIEIFKQQAKANRQIS